MSVYYLDENSKTLTEEFMVIEKQDPSLNGCNADSLIAEFRLNSDNYNRLFFSRYGIDYISQYFASQRLTFRVVTHPYETNTCYEKAELLGPWDPLSVIKALYFEYAENNALYAVVVPETGCFINRMRLRDILQLPAKGVLKKTNQLPRYMSLGTCSPFITKSDLKIHGGRVVKILFDRETLEVKKEDRTLDDFSFGLDHCMSVQMNYYDCFQMLKNVFPDVVREEELLPLSFNEKLRRTNGKMNITYEFQSVNYRTAKFINSIHGYGDVTIMNDYRDELDLPHVLIHPRRRLVNTGQRV